MVQYLLCAEDLRHGNAWAEWERRWHVARVGAAFAICNRQLEPAMSVRPIQDADDIPEADRCAACWERAFVDLMLPA
jgi:hypothetical protein